MSLEAVTWKAGVAAVDITPAEPIWMAGYAARKAPSQGVRRELYAKALALEDAGGAMGVLVTADLIGFRRAVSERIVERCRAAYGLDWDRLILSASHTHSGPVVGDPPYYAALDERQQQAVARYTDMLIDRVVRLIGEAIGRRAPAQVAFGQGLAGIAVNRRRAAPGRRHLPAPVDHDVPVLAVRDGSGRLTCVVAGYACHATSMGDYLISGDWPGFAQAEIEAAHPGAVAMFVQGCGADANPLPRYQGTDPALVRYAADLPRMYGRIFAAAVDLVLHSKMKPVGDGLRTAGGTVELPFQKIPSREDLEKQASGGTEYERVAARRLLAQLEREGALPASYRYPIQVWRLGEELKLIVLAGEVTVDYSLRLKAQHGWEDTWVAAYANDVFGYVPSLRVLREGGYEGGDANLTLPGRFSAAIEEIIVEKAGELIERTAPRRRGG